MQPHAGRQAPGDAPLNLPQAGLQLGQFTSTNAQSDYSTGLGFDSFGAGLQPMTGLTLLPADQRGSTDGASAALLHQPSDFLLSVPSMHTHVLPQALPMQQPATFDLGALGVLQPGLLPQGHFFTQPQRPGKPAVLLRRPTPLGVFRTGVPYVLRGPYCCRCATDH